MLKTLRRLFGSRTAPADVAVIRHWADQRGHPFLKSRHGPGCVVEGRQGQQAWRLEWGAAQRSYMGVNELRLMSELGLPRDLMLMVLNRPLMETMERQVYEQFVDDVQTRIDTETPAEMRWLVMHPKLTASELGRLRERFGAVGSVKPWLQAWLDGPLGDALWAAQSVTDATTPVTLSIHKGRLTLRVAAPVPDIDELTVWFAVFETALREVVRVSGEWRQLTEGGQTTQPSTWSPSVLSSRPDSPPER